MLAVDEQLVGETAGQALLAGVPTTTMVHPDTLSWDIGQGTVAGDKILFDVTVQAKGYAPPDPMEIKNEIKGKPVSEAQGILDTYGTAQISVWPGFPDAIPDDVGTHHLAHHGPRGAIPVSRYGAAVHASQTKTHGTPRPPREDVS